MYELTCEPHFIAFLSACFQRSVTLHISGISLIAGAFRRHESTSLSEQETLLGIRLFLSSSLLWRAISSNFLFAMVPPNLCLGRNDAGGSLDHKDESMQAFLSFLGVANDSPRRSRRGAYSCHTFGNANQIVKVISEGAFKSNKCILSIHVLAQAFATLATAKLDGGLLTTMASSRAETTIRPNLPAFHK